MEELMLERYFDQFIANPDPPRAEEVKKEKQVFLLFPDDLNYGHNKESVIFHPSPDISNRLDYGSQNTTGESQMRVEEKAEGLPPIITNIHNVMARCDVGRSLDLNFIASRTWNVEYNPKSFMAVTMRLRKPRITANIFSSGKIAFNGAKSVEDSQCGARRCVRKLQKIGLPITLRNFKICSVMATCKLFPVRLEELQKSDPINCSYVPELFVGLHYKMKPGLTLSIHASGMISATGAESPEEAQQAFERIRLILMPFRRFTI